ncbi:response regulator transcription factor [Fusobacterium sp.]|uniref:response regulator transcription factor n=1 Tax=Fusobacterium sp. TaxID=68766 RepID=UPI001F501A2A|nr:MULTISPECIES: response regulator transcription factor [Fusobacterium]MCI5725519.1 response regulator transcription factor [Fusobacterium sp.]
MKVLIVEDDLEIQDLVNYFLKKEGFKTEKTDNGLEALRLLKKDKFDFIILDLMLPQLSGNHVAKIVKEMPEEYGNPFIIILTAKTQIEDVLEGFSLGADDYLKKPFDPRELIVRIKKISQQNKIQTSNLYQFHSLILDDLKHLVSINDMEIELSKKEYDLLFLLLRNKGLVISRDKILDEIWGTSYYSGDRSVDVYISKLREKLPEIAGYIKTIKGVGYKLDEKNF